ncbi:hypothetical protein [Paraconexibacter algicola]|uniref:Uncharacterized protein n=2 Tax=Solirubrobacterales TaxID=588673 RepID=A0A2T4UMS0_9ACTN|nr:hypothetical protein [Paraconexibacter algicola]PTL60530.1 hypothetical protein C7Y72_13225 [Paraconexibacter algicola]
MIDAPSDPSAPEPTPGGPRLGTSPLRLADIVLIVMAAPVVCLLGAPVLGILAGAGVWVLNRVLELALARRAATREDVRAAIGYNLGGVIGRAWLVGLTILAVGTAGEREDGLAAAVLVFAAFTLYFANSLLARSFERNASPS